MAACDPGLDATGEVDTVSVRGLESNSFRLNGPQLNSFRLNSFRLNGQWLGASPDSDVRLAQARFVDGPVITKAWLVGGDLHVETELGEALSGAQLGGAELVFDVIEEGVLIEGRRARIVGIEPLGDDADAWVYDVVVQAEDDSWQPLCVDANAAATGALLLADVWDPATGARISPRPTGAVTIACRGGALAKCVEWGYAPWAIHDGVSLAETHQACTRAVRADYCGDGTPHTGQGVKIHVKDPLGIEAEDPNMPHVVEAEWGPDGALCLNYENTRMPAPAVGCDLPACDEPVLDTGMLQTGKVLTK